MKSKYYRINKKIENKHKIKCVFCGENERCCLEFHHIRDKKYNISQAVKYLTPDKFTEELNKCICVCKNCHAKLHKEIIKWQTS